MKKMISLAVVVLMAASAMSQQPVLTLITPDTHDFGTIYESDGKVTTVFDFKNEGMVPLILNNVKASCGCTSPNWTREPIEPGQTGHITVTFNPSGRPGKFNKTVTITSNAAEPTKRVFIKGEVIKKPVVPVDQYPVKMDGLGLKVKALDFKDIHKGETKELAIEFANQSKDSMTVNLLAHRESEFFATQLSATTLQPGETGTLQVNFVTDQCPLYGPVEAMVYVAVNGKVLVDNAHAIVLKANVTEDFSRLTPDQRMKAPILEVNNELEMGTVKAGKKMSCKLALANVGVDPLCVRRVIADGPGLKVTAPKGTVKGGKKGDIRLEVVAVNVEPAAYSRPITIITNDPNKPVITVQLHWTVE